MGAMQQPSLGGGDLSSAVNAAIAQRAMQYATPQQLPQIQHSAMLAEALQSIQKSGSQGLRTKGALASNLLAEALLALASHKANKQVAASDASNWQNMSSTMSGMIPGANGPDAPPAPASAPQTAEQAPSAPVDQPTPQAAPAPPQQAPAKAPFFNAAPPERDMLVRAMIGEGGDSPDDEAAVASTVLNRANKSGSGLADVLRAPHQFEAVDNPRTWSKLSALDPNSQAYQQADGVAQRVLNDGPTGPWTNFYSPGAQKALGRQAPAWDNGSGQTIGKQRFFNLDPGGAQSAASAGTPAAAQAPMPQPLQVANGPQPSMPAPNAQPFAQNPGAPPSPANSAPQGAAPSPQGQGQWALGPVPIQPQQRAHLQQLDQLAQSNPAFRQPFLEYARELQKQANEGEPFDTKIESGQQVITGKITGRQVVRPVDALQFRDQASAPNSFVQRGPDGQIHAASNPAYGSLGPNQHMGPDGSVSNQPVQQQPTFKIPGAPGLYVNGPDGRPMKVADDTYTPEAIKGLRDDVLKSDEYKNAVESTNSYSSMVALAKQAPGGMRAYALRDTFARTINPGAVARAGTIQAIKESQGIPANVQAFFLNLKGDGDVPANIVQQVLDAAQPFAAANWTAANRVNQGNADYAGRHQLDPRDVTAPMPAAPQAFHMQAPHAPAAAAPAAPGGQPTADQAAAALRARGWRQDAHGNWTK